MSKTKWTSKTRNRLPAILAAFAIVFGGIAAMSIKNAAPARADDGGYPYASTACVWAPYATDGTRNTNWCKKTDANGNIISDYDWGSIHDNSGPASEYSTYGYGYRNCTDYVAWKVASLGVSATQYKGLGNAKDWPTNAPGKGLTVSATPAVGAAVVNTSGTYGHVAFVQSVNTDGTITVSEYNHGTDGYYGTRTGTLSSLGFSQVVHFEKYETTAPLPPSSTPARQTSDLNADGTEDILLLTHDPDGATGANPGLSTSAGIWMKPEWWHDPYTDWASMTPLVGDVNADGKADLVYLIPTSTGTQAWVLLSTGNGFQSPQQWWNGTGWGYSGIKARLGDVDGNHAEDLVLVTNQPGGGSAAFVLLSTWGGFLSPQPWWSDPGVGWNGIDPLAGDLNGDGIADFVFLADSGTGTNAYVALSTGSSFGIPQLWWNGTGWGFAGIKPLLGDVDGNHAEDLVLVTSQPNGGSAAFVLLSTWEGFLSPQPWWSDPGVGWNGITPILGNFTNTTGVAGARRADFAFLADGGTASPIYVAPSTNSSFGIPSMWWSGAGWGYSGIKVAMR